MTNIMEFREIDEYLPRMGITRIREVIAIQGELEDGTEVVGIITSDVKRLLRDAYMTGHSRRTNWEGYLEEINS